MIDDVVDLLAPAGVVGLMLLWLYTFARGGGPPDGPDQLLPYAVV